MNSTKTVRKIVVDGREFCWKADWFYTWESGEPRRVVKFRAWRAEWRGVTLRANLMPGSPGYPSDDFYVTPKDVALLIRYSLEQGWELDGANGDFWLKKLVELELDNFRQFNLSLLDL